MTGYNTRQQDMEKAHGVNGGDWEALIKAISPNHGEKILDLMGGNGAVATKLYDYASRQNMALSLSVMDAFKTQLERAPLYLEKILGDARAMPSESENYDKIVVKMGFHEIPLAQQVKAVKEAYRALKPEGKLIIWMVGLEDKAQQNAFNKFSREKDRIAGFDELVKNRYFPTIQETKKYLADAGFSEIQEQYKSTSVMNTSARLNGDFAGNKSKLESFNNYIRTNFNEFRQYLGARDLGENIETDCPVCIITAEKLKGGKN